MKTKIANALKTKYSNLGLGEKAFNGVAEFLVNTKTVEKEEDIENVIAGSNIEALLKAFQGDIDSVRTQKSALQREYDEYKAKHPEKTQETTEGDKANEELLKRLEALENASKEREKANATEALLKEAARLMGEKKCQGEKLISLALKDVKIEDGDTAEKIAEKAIPAYNTWKKDLYGDSPIPGVAAPAAEGYKKGDYAGFVQSLRDSGQLPAENK